MPTSRKTGALLLLLGCVGLVAAQTQPTVILNQVATCDFLKDDPNGVPCNIILNGASTLQAGELRYVTYTNVAQNCKSLDWSGYAYSVSMTNNRVGNQALMFQFGVAANESVASACMTSVWAGGSVNACKGVQAARGIYYSNGALMSPVTRTLVSSSDSMAMSGNVATYLLSPDQVAQMQSFVVFMGSLSTLNLTVTNFQLSIKPQFIRNPLAAPQLAHTPWLLLASSLLMAWLLLPSRH